MASIEERVSALENLLGVLITDIRATRTEISSGFGKIDENFVTIQKKFNKLDSDILKLHSKVDVLSGKTDKDFKDVNLKLVSIKDEISNINKVTKYEDELNNLKIIQGGKK